uniref:Protein disulfide isomerase-like 2-2 n=1 Tax=Lygus hesperus TaxID=30085 RepID=A0A146LCP2_LYGHE
MFVMNKLMTVALCVLVLVSLGNVSAEAIELNPSNFDKIVKDSSKNVFVKFYAPWCGHCNNMKPEWDKLAEAYPVSGKTIIASLNADEFKTIAANSNVYGYPTLIYYPKGNKTGVHYDGERSISAFKKFMADNTK